MSRCYEQTIQPHLQPHIFPQSLKAHTQPAAAGLRSWVCSTHPSGCSVSVWVCKCVLVGQPATDAATILRPSTSGDNYD